MNSKEWTEHHRGIWNAEISRRGLNKCSICGYDRCLTAIELHHTVAPDKEKAISRLKYLKPTPERFAELDKVVSLCANCHRELHDKDKSKRIYSIDRQP